MADSLPLEQILADARERSAVLRAEGHAAQAATLERMCDEVATSAADYLTWLGEERAQTRSGKSVPWLRGRFAEWEAEGLARRTKNGRREYRQVVIPRRVHETVVREAAKRGERVA